MEEPELGKTEEILENTSSAELSESETAATSEAIVSEVGDTPTEVDDTEESVEITSEASVTEDVAQTSADETDESDGEEEEPVEEAGGLRRGEVLEGTITRTTPNEIFVDLGEGREGLVPKREVELMSGRMLERMKEGANIHVYVVNPSNHRGEIILSINHAQEELDWRKAEEYLESKNVYDGKIGGYNKGGLIVRFGRLRGFVPQSQISDKRLMDIEGETPEERYSGMVNKQISVKVMEVDRSRNRLILSERAAMREVRQRRKEALITELEVGEVREGRVVSLENFGAFVDIGGAEGLIHITELSWKHVTHPKQVLSVGQTVEVKVINVDEEKNRIGLSLKQLQPDPWDELATRFGTGALIRGTVTKLTKFGAFAEVDALDAVEGLIHISELSDERVEHPRDVVQRGDKLTLRVVKIDVKNRRLGLSLRRVNSAEFLDEDLRRAYIDMDENRSDIDHAPSATGDVHDVFEADDEEDEIVAETEEAEEIAEAEEAEETAEVEEAEETAEVEEAEETEVTAEAEEIQPEPETEGEEE